MARIGEQERARLHQAMMSVVDTQLETDDPPETRATLDRLIAEGHDPDQARHLIAGAVVEMTVRTLRGHEYDPAHYVKLLDRLPKMPWEE